MVYTILLSVLISTFFFLSILISIAFLTLIERKFIASTQNRKGPNRVGYVGLLQPFADAAKLIIKESIFPRNSKFIIFIIAPLISLFFALITWAFIPFSYQAIIVDINLGLFFIFVTSILHIYGVILSGWSSGSRYSFLGALRSTAQLVAYDISIGIIICSISLFTNSLSLIDIVSFQDRYGYLAFYLPSLFALFLTSSLAETNRHPFDLPEAESELVGGYNTEYASSYFAFFFLGEYCSILLMVFLINHLFLGGWTTPFNIAFLSIIFYSIKLLLIYYFFLIIRAAIPRYRYDQLMRLGWKFILPLSLSLFLFLLLIILIQERLFIMENLSTSPKNYWQYRQFFYDYFYGLIPIVVNIQPPKTSEDYFRVKKIIYLARLMPEYFPGVAKFRSILLYTWFLKEGCFVNEEYYLREAINNGVPDAKLSRDLRE